MSRPKSSFRARPLEVSKPMPIYLTEDIPDLPEYSAINRAVPQMPSGMKTEEESEHHLQRAFVTGLSIPTPEVTPAINMTLYNQIYPPNYKAPRQLIHMEPSIMEQDVPDYDMDSDDEKWLDIQSKTMDINALKFEEMMEKLEKNSEYSLVTQSEAKVLLKEDDDLIIAVYNYWLNKRLQTRQSLIPCVMTEVHRGSNSNKNSYLAFQRRNEKMQTRKNRKNDESSYMKMLKLKRDLTRAQTLLELVKKRENAKRDLLDVTMNIFEKRYQAEDFSSQMVAEVSNLKTPRSAFAPLFTYESNDGTSPKRDKEKCLPRKEKRQYKKRKHKGINANLSIDDVGSIISSEDDDTHSVSPPTSPTHDEGPFAFRRKANCSYHAPLNVGVGFGSRDSREDVIANQGLRFNLTYITTPTIRCVGFTRRRLGRGGRVILDRVRHPMDDYWSTLDFTILDNSKKKSSTANENIEDMYLQMPHFYPQVPKEIEHQEEQVLEVTNNTLSLMVEDLDKPNDELTEVHLDLSELFPSLVWDQELINHESDLELITPVSKRKLDVSNSVEPTTSEILTQSVNDYDVRKNNFKSDGIDRKDYHSGSLLDGGAKSESFPSRLIKISKPLSPEDFDSDDLSVSSIFRVTNSHPDSVELTVYEANPAVPVIVEEQEKSSFTEEMSVLPPASTMENKIPFHLSKGKEITNETVLSNGAVSLAHSDLLVTD